MLLYTFSAAQSHFVASQTQKLGNLQILTLADVVIFRFIVRITFVETAGWVGFIFLQVLVGYIRIVQLDAVT